MAVSEEPHKDLMKWAITEMKYFTSAWNASGNPSLPTEQDFKELFKPPLSDVWLFAVKNLQSARSVKKIKDNLAVQNYMKQTSVSSASNATVYTKNDDIEMERLLQEKARLQAELLSCESNSDMLEQELGHIKSDMAQTELEYQDAVERVRDVQRKDSLIHVVHKCAEESVARYTEYARRVKQRMQDVVDKRENIGETKYSTGTKGEVESEHCRDTRLACEEISNFLKKALDGEFSDKKEIESAKCDLSQRLEGHISSYSAGTLVSALTSNTVSAGHNTREATVGLNIAKDVQDLSFSFGRKGLQDVSSPTTVQESVRQLLQASNLEHVMRWFKEQEHKNESWKLEARLDDLLSEIDKHLQRLLGENLEHKALAKQYIDSLIALAAEKSVLPCVRDIEKDLTERKEKAKEEKEELKQKFERIQNFRKLVNKKQSTIEILAKQNSQAPQRLSEQQSQLMLFISERGMSSHKIEVQSLSSSLNNSFAIELNKFAGLLMPCLLTVQLDSTRRQCVLDLSLAPTLHPVLGQRSSFYTDICRALGFPTFKSADSLLEHVQTLHRQTQTHKWKQQFSISHVQAAKEAAKTDDDFTAVLERHVASASALCEEVREHEKKQTSKLVPRLEETNIYARYGPKEINKLNQLTQIWWEQPSQHLTPWVITEGMTFDQWMQRWRIAVSQEHKTRMQRKKNKDMKI